MTDAVEYCGHPTTDCLFSEELSALRAENAALRADLGHLRMCVTCGRYADAATVQRGDTLPECTGPEGLAGCTFDMTPREAADYWGKLHHEARDERDAMKADLMKIAAHRYGLQGIQEDYGHDTNAYNYHAYKYYSELASEFQAIARAALKGDRS